MVMAQHATITFDTLQYAKRLQKAGFTEVQAEAQVEIIKEQVEAISSRIDGSLATKQDIAELKRDIKELELKIVIKLSGIMGGMIAVAIAILGFLIKLH